MLKKQFLCLFFFLSPLVVMAGNDDLIQAKFLINKYFGASATMQADFIQHIFDSNYREIESMKGAFSIEKPKRFRWHYKQPYEQIFLADGINFWTYDVDLEQVIVKPQKQFLARAQFILFFSDSELMQRFEIISADLENEIFWIRLKSIVSQKAGDEIALGFRGNILFEIKLIDSLGQKITINFKNLILNKIIESTVFELDFPLGTDILGKPLIPVN